VRQGFPEEVFWQGKTGSQVAEIMEKLAAEHPNILGARASEEMFAEVEKHVPNT